MPPCKTLQHAFGIYLIVSGLRIKCVSAAVSQEDEHRPQTSQQPLNELNIDVLIMKMDSAHWALWDDDRRVTFRFVMMSPSITWDACCGFSDGGSQELCFSRESKCLSVSQDLKFTFIRSSCVDPYFPLHFTSSRFIFVFQF